ncbi:hypothetical protein CVV68_14050 [Arthrobacter livingstonensis]|uniref:Uncharacterized protein n=1 Tax=Arthrobacter livingstonensis TaxID=670078 RepID=A0A2V5L501_9MICC|nr:hypothetical protein [Arthrobacter livingstonensis]PYI66415.1 hypothetical protein CVV68_14050 [Arthrobacter livingstonensis]
MRTSRGSLGGVPVVEVLADGADAVAAYRGLHASGVPHVFQGIAAELDEGAAALESTGRFPCSHLGAERPYGGRPPQCHLGPERNHHCSAASMT